MNFQKTINSHIQVQVDDFDEILRHVVKQKEYYCVIGITMLDLYMDSTDEFCMGVASMQERLGLFSFARYSPRFFTQAMLKSRQPTEPVFVNDSKLSWQEAKKVLTLRSMKICCHEVIFILQLIHNWFKQ